MSDRDAINYAEYIMGKNWNGEWRLWITASTEVRHRYGSSSVVRHGQVPV